jgi:2-amino-4-hydroxy-6-hydroxymethyldihydropteridine diphosphokinase
MTSSGWRTVTVESEASQQVFLGVGTNLGDRRTNLTSALRELEGLGVIEGVSSVYESEPVGFADQPPFWNLVVRLCTSLRPLDLLHELKRLEHRLGRRPTFRHGPRVIDLDVLLYGAERIDGPELEVPHPRMMERAFVLLPLVELEPELHHPVTGERFADRLAEGGFERAILLFPGTELLSDRNSAVG